MILSKVLEPPKKLISSANDKPIFVLNYLNELKKENIVQMVSNCNAYGLMNYVVFYEDKNVFTCPKCGHDISNTFSFCPNCATKLK